MCPRWRALEHPAAPLLKEYTGTGCPVDVGCNWTLEELETTVGKGLHSSSLKQEAVDQTQIKAREKK